MDPWLIDAALGALAPVLSGPGQWLRGLNPNIPSDHNPATSVRAEWYLSPEQHILELVILSSLYVVLIAVGWSRAWSSGVVKNRGSSHNNLKGIWLDKVYGFVCLGLFVLMYYYKSRRGSAVYLLQPCHLLTLAHGIVGLSVGTKSHFLAELIYNANLYVQFAPFLALATPDTRDYADKLEIFFFFFQHYAICFFPIYMTIRQRFTIYNSAWWTIFSFSVWALLHVVVYFPCSIFLGVNLNYMMVPPPPMKRLGRYYRFVMQPFSWAVSIASGLSVYIAVFLFPRVDYSKAVNNTTKTTAKGGKKD